jgi:L-fuculose-phosphate aldolase
MTDTRTDLAAAARELDERGLTFAASGNLSLRVDDRVLITPRGAVFGEFTPEDAIEVALDGKRLAGERTPSSELPFHLALYRDLGAGAVVHTHSHHAVVLSTLLDEVPILHYAMADFGGPMRVAPYATFGSDDLATGVVAALKDRRGALMQNHGAVVVADTIAEAVRLATLLEWSCSVVHDALMCGTPRALSDRELDDFARQREAFAYGVLA